MKARLIVLLMVVVLLPLGGLALYLTSQVHEQEAAGGAQVGQEKSKKKTQHPSGQSKKSSGSLEGVPPRHDIPLSHRPPVANEQQAREVVHEESERLGLGDGVSLELGRTTDDGRGNQYYQLEQYYQGLPVWGALAVLEVEAGSAVALSGHWWQSIDLDVQPRFEAARAVREALINLGGEEPEFRLEGDGKLLVYLVDQRVHLAWFTQVDFVDVERESEFMLVDAHTPGVLLRYPVRRH